jgi:hypothetical protein
LRISIDIFTEKYLKKLIGNTDVEDVLRRLDRLTLEEAHMASLELLKVSHNVEGRVVRIGEGVQSVGDTMQEVDERVQDVRDAVQAVGDGVQDVQQLVQGLDGKVDQGNRELSPNPISLTLQTPQILAGNDLRDRLRIWLSPPDPSINHNIACDARHKGSAQWFFRGTIFNQWKSTGPFLKIVPRKNH